VSPAKAGSQKWGLAERGADAPHYPVVAKLGGAGLKCLREKGIVPTGLWFFFPLYPTLKALGYPVPRLRRCIPDGNELLCSTNCLEIGFSRRH